MANNYDNIHYKAEDIKRYLSGQLSAQEMHAMEKASLDDPFLADAIDGYAEEFAARGNNIEPHVEELGRRLKDRMVRDEKPRVYNRPASWKIAAVFILLAGTSVLVYTFINDSPERSSVVRNESAKFDDTPYKKPGGSTATTGDSSSVAFNTYPRSKQADVVAPGRSSRRSGNSVSTHPSGSADTLFLERFESGAEKESGEDIAALSQREKSLYKAAPVENAQTTSSSTKERTERYFSGKVTGKNNKPVPGASVRIIGNTKLNLTSDSDGSFNFLFPDTMAAIVIRAAGFDINYTTIYSSQPDHTIILSENKNVVGDIAVTGYGKERKAASEPERLYALSKSAEPQNGWVAFNRYLERNKKLSPVGGKTTHGDVKLSFLIGLNGRPGKFKIEKSVSPDLDLEAIRLIKEGPSWKLLNGGDSRATITITF